MSDDGLFQMDLNLHPNEASGLLIIEDEVLLHGWKESRPEPTLGK